MDKLTSQKTSELYVICNYKVPSPHPPQGFNDLGCISSLLTLLALNVYQMTPPERKGPGLTINKSVPAWTGVQRFI